ncbi:centrosome-associated protein CEP250-like isoform X2 [Polypterus senegalus]|uniref:centrosome-associated protein CEP250-like isoform X2 n=1 Tax=Polypterus senegalus TaxID=55291 RepID=UPI001964E9B5|nr:centrosome-associated protein CEP250-like isoform X2 [Polypterus senegalus]
MEPREKTDWKNTQTELREDILRLPQLLHEPDAENLEFQRKNQTVLERLAPYKAQYARRGQQAMLLKQKKEFVIHDEHSSVDSSNIKTEAQEQRCNVPTKSGPGMESCESFLLEELITDWRGELDDFKCKEEKWEKERELLKSCINGERGRLNYLWKEVSSFRRCFDAMKTSTSRDLCQFQNELNNLSTSLMSNVGILFSTFYSLPHNYSPISSSFSSQTPLASNKSSNETQKKVGEDDQWLIEKSALETRIVDLSKSLQVVTNERDDLIVQGQKREEERDREMNLVREAVEKLGAIACQQFIDEQALRDTLASSVMGLSSLLNYIAEIQNIIHKRNQKMQEIGKTVNNHISRDFKKALIQFRLEEQERQPRVSEPESLDSIDVQTTSENSFYYLPSPDSASSEATVPLYSHPVVKTEFQNITPETWDNPEVVSPEQSNQSFSKRSPAQLNEEKQKIEIFTVQRAIDGAEMERDMIKIERDHLQSNLKKANDKNHYLSVSCNQLTMDLDKQKDVVAKMSDLNTALAVDKQTLNSNILQLEMELCQTRSHAEHLEHDSVPVRKALKTAILEQAELKHMNRQLLASLAEAAENEKKMEEKATAIKMMDSGQLKQVSLLHNSATKEVNVVHQKQHLAIEYLKSAEEEKDALLRQLETLEIEMQQLKNDKESVETERNTMRSLYETMKEKVLKTDMKNKDLETVQTQLEVKVQTLQEANEVFKGEINCVRTELSMEISRLKSEEGKLLEEKESESAKAKSEIDRLIGELASLRQELSTAEQKNKEQTCEWKTELQNQENEKAQWQQERESLNTELGERDGELKKLKTRTDALLQEKEGLNKLIAQKDEEIESLNENLNLGKENLRDRSVEIEILKGRVEDLIKESDLQKKNNEEEINRLKELVQGLEKKNEEYTINMKTKDSELKEKYAEVEKCAEKIEKLLKCKDEINSLVEVKAVETDRLNDYISVLEKEKDRLRSEMSKYAEETERMQVKYRDELNHRTIDFENQKRDLFKEHQESLEIKDTEIKRLGSIVLTLERKGEELDMNVKAESTKSEKLLEKIKEMHQTEERLNAELQRIKIMDQNLQNENNNMINELRRMEELLMALKEEKYNLTAKVNDLNKEAEDQTKLLRRKDEEITQLKDRIAMKVKETECLQENQKDSQKFVEKNRQMDTLIQELNEKLNEREKKEGQFSRRLISKEAEIGELQEEVRLLQEKLKQNLLCTKEKQEQVDLLSQSIQVARKEKEALEKQYNDQTVELKLRDDEVQKLKDHASKIQNMHLEKYGELGSEKEELRLELFQKNTEIQGLKMSLERFCQEKETLSRSLVDSQTEIHRLNERMNVNNEEIQTLKQRIENMRNEREKLDLERTEKNKEICQLTEQISTLKKEQEELSRKEQELYRWDEVWNKEKEKVRERDGEWQEKFEMFKNVEGEKLNVAFQEAAMHAEKIKVLEKEKQDLESQLKLKDHDYNICNEKLFIKINEIALLNEKINKLQDELQNYQTFSHKRNQRENALEIMLEAERKKYNLEQREREDESENLRREIDELQCVTEHALADLRQKNEAVQKYEERMRLNRENLQKLMSMIEMKNKEISKLNKTNEMLHKEGQKKLMDKEQEIAAQKEKERELFRTEQKKEEEIYKLRMAVKETQQEADRVSACLQEREAEVRKLKYEMERKYNEISKLRIKMEEMQKETTSKLLQDKSIMRENMQLRLKIKKIEGEGLQEIRDKLKIQEEKLIALMGEKKEQILKLKEQIQILEREQTNKLLGKVGKEYLPDKNKQPLPCKISREDEIEKLNMHLKESQREMEYISGAVKQKSVEIEWLARRMVQLEIDRKNLHSVLVKADESEWDQNFLAKSLDQEIGLLQESMSYYLQKWGELTTAADKAFFEERSAFQNRISAMQRAVAQLEYEKKHLEEEKKKLVDTLKRIKKERGHLKEQLIKRESMTSHHQNCSEEDQLKNRILELEGQVFHLKRILEQFFGEKKEFCEQSSKNSQQILSLRQDLSQSLAHVSQAPLSSVLDSETQRLDRSVRGEHLKLSQRHF